MLQFFRNLRPPQATRCAAWTVAGCLALLVIPGHTHIAQAQTAATASSTSPGVPLTAPALAALLPSSVYFQGKTATLQLRNTGGTTFKNGAVVWAGLVDTSGYASDVQNRYQFYFVTETALHFGDALLSAGAYGGGFVGDRFFVMDLGGHTVAEGATQNDAQLQRPRPLQVLAATPDSVKLYLGRHWVLLSSQTNAAR